MSVIDSDKDDTTLGVLNIQTVKGELEDVEVDNNL
jgi:hypothetical protein